MKEEGGKRSNHNGYFGYEKRENRMFDSFFIELFVYLAIL